MEYGFWERLDDLTEKTIPRKELADKVGISVGTIAAWKARRNYPTADVAAKISKALGVTVEYLINGEELKYWYPSNISDIVEDLKIIDDDSALDPIRTLAHTAAERKRKQEKDRAEGSALEDKAAGA